MIKFTIPSLPQSMNQIYNIIPYWSQKRIKVELKDDCRKWKSQAKEYIPVWREELKGEGFFYLRAGLYYDHFYKNGKVRKVDGSNLEKLIIDAVCEKIKIDDSYLKDRHFIDYHSEKERVEIEVGFLDSSLP